MGALAGLALLVLIVLGLGPLLDQVPLRLLQLGDRHHAVAVRDALVAQSDPAGSGVIALHDEDAAFAGETAELRGQARRRRTQLDWLAALASFKAVLLEGLEVVFIVIAVGAGGRFLVAAGIGALLACGLVMMTGFVLHRPLARVPENTLKFAVGVMLSAFGVFWTGEGLGVPWPGQDLAILGFAAVFLVVALASVTLATRRAAEALR